VGIFLLFGSSLRTCVRACFASVCVYVCVCVCASVCLYVRMCVFECARVFVHACSETDGWTVQAAQSNKKQKER
jgi:hypothetical protein